MSVASSFPTLAEADRAEWPSTHLPFHRIWGPISQEASTTVGAEFATSSVLIEPLFEVEVVDAAIATVPMDHSSGLTRASCYECDDKCGSQWCELPVASGGRGDNVRLNATHYPQPRRRSVTVDQDDEQITMLNYTAYGRLAQDWESVPMPRPIFTLGCCCWQTAYALLTEQSKAKPPTGCQLLLYYTLFDYYLTATLAQLQQQDGSHTQVGAGGGRSKTVEEETMGTPQRQNEACQPKIASSLDMLWHHHEAVDTTASCNSVALNTKLKFCFGTFLVVTAT